MLNISNPANHQDSEIEEAVPSLSSASAFAFSVQRWLMELLESQVFEGRIDKQYRGINAAKVRELVETCTAAQAIFELWSEAWDGTAKSALWHCKQTHRQSLLGKAMRQAVDSPYDFASEPDLAEATADSAPGDLPFRTCILATLGASMFLYIRARAAESLAAGSGMSKSEVAHILALTNAFVGMMREVQALRFQPDSHEDLQDLLEALEAHLHTSRMELGGKRAALVMSRMASESVESAMAFFPGQQLESFLHQRDQSGHGLAH